MNDFWKPERLPGEKFEAYKERQRAQKEKLRAMKRGRLIWLSRFGTFRRKDHPDVA